ncbi:MAG: hypothetical protein JWR61_1051 [Ferruginibacter sp.]|nr:hypothetical protein [Ferruginibacter sp.]
MAEAVIKKVMKLYTCTSCGNPIYFENSTCLQCSHALGFDDSKFKLVALENNQNAYSEVNNKNQLYRYCSNAVMGTCNWLIPVNSVSPFCTACELNRIIPELNTADNQAKWKRIEVAKHRLVYSLLRLRLPVKAKQNPDDAEGIAFDFMADVSPEERIMTGHDNGIITLNIEEADEAERARHKSELGERYRTLLGHFRHEIGHYYWEILIKDSPYLEKYRQLFGDEQKDYGEALQTYYANQTPANWNDAFISPYATAHPWEDWAETWAHYMHMMDTLETAWSFGINIQRPEIKTSISNDPYSESNFINIINRWYPLAFAVNSLNRSMGHADFYPFVISAPVVQKLQFIHEVCGVGK